MEKITELCLQLVETPSVPPINSAHYSVFVKINILSHIFYTAATFFFIRSNTELRSVYFTSMSSMSGIFYPVYFIVQSEYKFTFGKFSLNTLFFLFQHQNMYCLFYFNCIYMNVKYNPMKICSFNLFI